MSDVFISHVEENSDLAVEIAAGLEAGGFSTWYYERDSLPGPSYLLQTSREIESSQAVVLIISSESLASHQVTKEVIRAHESGKPLVPVLKSITQTEFASRQPEWKEAVGSATYFSVPRRGANGIVPQILRNLRESNIEPIDDSTHEAHTSFFTPPPPAKKPLFRLGPLKVFPLTAVIAATVLALLTASGIFLASRNSTKTKTGASPAQQAVNVPVLRPKAATAGDSSASQQPESSDAPVATREVKTSAGTLTIERVAASDRFMECPLSAGKCVQRSGGKFVLGITFRSVDGKSTTELQRALTQEALSSYVKTPQGKRVDAYNFDLISPKSSISLIYAYMDAGITTGLVLYWRGNPPIAIQTGGTSAGGAPSGSGGGSSSNDSFREEPVQDNEPPPDAEPPPEEEPPPDEEPPPPPDEQEPPPPPDEEPPPAEEPPPE